MKLNRLLEITIILLNKRSVTASELAERFGVSVRTIYRDIEDLSCSGIPVCTLQGQGGGISILEGFSLGRTMLSQEERESILLALQAMQVTRYPEVGKVIEKLGSLFQTNGADWITVDFTPWGSSPNSYNKFFDLKTAILERRVTEIEYRNAHNERTVRRIEPMRLMFKSHSWYLWGYCRRRLDYRTFRISRIKRVELTDVLFNPQSAHQVPEEQADGSGWTPPMRCVLRFSYQALYRLYDEYDDNLICDNGDGTYTVTVEYPEDEWVYGYIMGFGPYVEVLEPEKLRTIIRGRLEQSLSHYHD